MDLYGSHFEFGGISSRKYGLIFANVETDRNTSLMGAFETNTAYSKQNNRRYIMRDNYGQSPVEFDIDIVSADEKDLGVIRLREIEKWLFGNTQYRKLYMDMADDTLGEASELIDGKQKRLYLNCRFKNPQRLEYNGGVVGFKVTVECDSCMAWQDPIVKVVSVNNTDSSGIALFDILTDTDLNDYIYPKVTISIGSLGGDIIIANNTDSENRLTKFVGLGANTSLTMNGDINYISGNNYERFTYQNFIRLLDGNNAFTAIGNIKEITFEWQNRRYL